jgi:Cu2+-exporting ATPase
MCCRGCQAVAQTIVDSGLTNYYLHRSSNAPSGGDLIPEALKQYLNYDDPSVQQEFVANTDHRCEALLSIDGISCAACAWLIEKHVMALDGIEQLDVNSGTHRATLRWHPAQITLSTILTTIHQLGYRAAPFSPDQQESYYDSQLKSYLQRIGVAGLASMQVMMFAIALYSDLLGDMAIAYRDYFRWVSLLMATPVLLYSAQPFYQAAWRSIRGKILTMDVPVSLALLGTYGASAMATITGMGDVYFESVSMFTLLLLVGRMLELRARRHASLASANMLKLVPQMAQRVNDQGALETVPSKNLKVGDRVRLLPGETSPCDGQVIEGHSELDESILTGESMPVEKTIGSIVYTASINHLSPLTLQVTATHQQTLMATILRLMNKAHNEKPEIATFTDKIARYFVTALLLIATMTYSYWHLQGNPEAFWITIAVLVATCPCALSLATPTALTVATSRLSRMGLLIKRGHVLEQLAELQHVVSDKTGTLTQGKLTICDVVRSSPYRLEKILGWSAALEAHTSHPIKHAFDQYASGESATSVEVLTGLGVQGVVAKHHLQIGSPTFTATQPSPRQGFVELIVKVDSQLAARIYLSDPLKTDAKKFADLLRQSNIQLSILSGDTASQVADIAQQLGHVDFKAGALPQDKLLWLQELQGTSPKLLMLGDGVNDAPVLASAPLSIAIGQGSDLAKVSADAILLGSTLAPLANAIKLSRQCRNIIHQNLAWALGYNSIILPLAVSGWVTPYIAVIGMSASSFLVLANSLRLNKL